MLKYIPLGNCVVLIDISFLSKYQCSHCKVILNSRNYLQCKEILKKSYVLETPCKSAKNGTPQTTLQTVLLFFYQCLLELEDTSSIDHSAPPRRHE